jgi:hypothetical protein
MIHFIQVHTSVVLLVFSLLSCVTSIMVSRRLKRRKELQVSPSRTEQMWMIVWIAHLIAFGGFMIGVLAAST